MNIADVRIYVIKICLQNRILIVVITEIIYMTDQIADPVRKCLRALEAAQTDTEKFATLFLVPKLVKGVDCDKNARLHLMKVNQFHYIR